jgi:hypothetical protein
VTVTALVEIPRTEAISTSPPEKLEVFSPKPKKRSENQVRSTNQHSEVELKGLTAVAQLTLKDFQQL